MQNEKTDKILQQLNGALNDVYGNTSFLCTNDEVEHEESAMAKIFHSKLGDYLTNLRFYYENETLSEIIEDL